MTVALVEPGLDPLQLALAQTVADQKYVTAVYSAVFEQFERELERAIGAAALGRHDGAIECRQQRQDGIHVAGQRRHRKGVGGINQQRGLSFGPERQYIGDFVPRPRQPRGFDIGCIHRAR